MEKLKEDSKSNVYQFRNNGSMELDSNSANLGHSGNTDVDVQVIIQFDTKPIGYALLCYLLATKQLSESEFETAVNKMEEHTGKKETKNVNNKELSSNKQNSKSGKKKKRTVARKKKKFKKNIKL